MKYINCRDNYAYIKASEIKLMRYAIVMRWKTTGLKKIARDVDAGNCRLYDYRDYEIEN